MAAWRTWASMAALVAATLPAQAQNHTLKETLQTGNCFEIQLDMNLTGEIHVVVNDKPNALTLAATARHGFVQRMLEVDAKGVPQKAAFVYTAAEAAIQAGASQSKRLLRPERSLLVVDRSKDTAQVYCPAGALTREELELTSEHFDTLALTGLLPDKDVARNDSWKVSTEAAQALCHFEGLSSHDLSCKLDDVKGDTAFVSVTGTAAGIDLGAQVKLNIQATYQFDLKTRCLVGLEWKQKDERTQGPASPASVTETTYTVKRKPVDRPESLSDVALVSVPQGGIPEDSLQLYYRDPKSRFELQYDRDWQITSQTEERTVLRLLDRGDFVAQVTITPWTKARPGEHLSPEDFQRAMASAPWKQEEVLQASVLPSTEAGRWVYRLSAAGILDGIKVLQNFYLIAGPSGDQIVMAFTTSQNQTDKLGTRDVNMVGGLKVLAK